MGVKVEKRRWEAVESRYLAEYIAKYFGDEVVHSMTQVPMGDTAWRYGKAMKLPERYFFRYGRRCDAVVITRKDLNLLEAETRRPIYGYEELLVYRKLLPLTPSLKPYLNLPVRCILVSPVWEADVYDMCHERGIEYHLYRPKWIFEALMRWGILTGTEEVIDVVEKG